MALYRVKTTTLTNMFRMIIRHSCDDLLATLYLCMSEVGPSYEELELGIGPKILTKAIMNSSDASKQAIERQRREAGDWGDVAYNLRARSRFIRPKQLLARDVFHTLQVMPTMKGAGSEAQKTEKIVKILKHCEGEEIRFFVRTLVQHLRIGAVRNTILTALSHAVLLEFELPRAAKNSISKDQLTEAEEIVKEAYAQLPNLDILIPILLDPTIGLYNLREACRCAPGVPIRPMLGKITTGIDEVVQKFSGLAYCADYKYDGERAQIHCDSSGKVSVFSRNLKLSKKWADVHEFIPEIKAESTTSFIIDAEIVAIDDEGRIQPLQTLMNRQRKNGTLQTLKQKVYVCAFDLMYLNNQSLIKLDFRARREQLEKAFRPVERKFCFVPQLCSDEIESPEQLRRFFEQSLVDRAEGLMVKLLDTPPPAKTRVAYSATYEPDKRTDSWLKVKKEYDEGIMDTLDLVPIGAWRGSGRKKDFFSVFLLAAYNKETEMFETVCRCMTGTEDHEASGSEKQSGTTSEPLIVIERPKSYYLVKETPHVWLEPTEVWEIKGGAITQSPVHTAGVTSMTNGRGLSLRVPVFLRLRPDKTPEEATSTQEVLCCMTICQIVALFMTGLF
ncbi:ATP-dependent DNA ligase [Gaertneriomyces semiglobifer]|nr:ATP-dependent DNA ligase [Gaertneriomyces semiglobifer]